MKRNEVIQFRVSPEERAAMEENAGQAGVTLSEWVRVRALSHGGSLGQVALPDTDPQDAYVAEMKHVDHPELSKLVKQLEAQGKSPSEALKRARKILAQSI